MQNLLLKKIYREICYGYSPFHLDGRELYFKHLNTFDKIRCDEHSEKAYERAKRLGKKNEKDLLKDCIDLGVWSKKDDELIESYRQDIRTMSKRKFESFDEEQIEQNDLIVKEYTEKLNELYNRKSDLLKNSAEAYSNHEYTINYIIESIFTDSSLKNPLWSDEEKKYLTFKDITKYYHIYNAIFSNYSDDNIRKIAIAHFFQDPFSIISDSTLFFNVSPHSLSEFQIRLLRYGKYFKEILPECGDIDQEDSNDPDRLEQWVVLKRNRAANPEYEKKKKTEQSIHNLFSNN